jgi:hypothetical protein
LFANSNVDIQRTLGAGAAFAKVHGGRSVDLCGAVEMEANRIAVGRAKGPYAEQPSDNVKDDDDSSASADFDRICAHLSTPFFGRNSESGA